jgi:hypothetical protein
MVVKNRKDTQKCYAQYGRFSVKEESERVTISRTGEFVGCLVEVSLEAAVH